MAQRLTPTQSWLLLTTVAVVFASLVLMDALVWGFCLLLLVVFSLGAWLVWQAITEQPSEAEEVTSTEGMPHSRNAPGDFFVEQGCCLTCEVPTQHAPDLFAFDDDGHCFVCLQPSTGEEHDRMIAVFRNQEFDCIQYRGTNAHIRRRIDGAVRGRGDGVEGSESPTLKTVNLGTLWFIVTIGGLILGLLSAIGHMGG